MSEALLAPSWWMLLAGVVLAVGLFVYANMRLNGRLRLASVGILLGTGIWWGVGYWVETPIEAATVGTRQFVVAVVARDAGTIDRLLSEESAIGPLAKGVIVRQAPGWADDWGLQSARITGSLIQHFGDRVIVDIRVVSEHSGGRVQIPMFASDWQLTWVREPDRWRIRRISPVQVGGIDPDTVIRRYLTTPE